MLAPLSWLREFVPYEGTAQALGEKLTMLGLELEAIQHPFAHLAEIKVGFVAACRLHPDSDHLHCCKVDIGSGELLDIVCGAPNVAEGQKVAVAPVGSTLPDGTVIKKAKLRGQPSFGMICSERELGLSDDHSGILVLPESADIGHSLLNALDLERDVLELSITPNRSDCLSIFGIARETAMAFNLPLHMPELPLIFDPRLPSPSVKITIDDPELCWLYAGRIASGITVAQAPLRMRCRLLSVGQRPVNNIVDITNYILFETGQPLHAFDLGKLEGGQIIVKRAKDNEAFTTLDGKKRILKESDLCICDTQRIVALAGVMGGLDSEITKDTENVFLESAVFQPQTVRKTARRLALHSEASFRFERGVDQQGSIRALNRASSLMQSIASGNPSSALSLVEPRPFIAKKIEYRPKRACMVLGIDLTPEFQADALQKDGCGVMNKASETWLVSQPSWRPDLTREADLVEEVGRIYGFDTIPPALPCHHHPLGENLGTKSAYDLIAAIKHWAAGIGLNEVINYSFTSGKELDELGELEAKRIRIHNPLSEDQNTMRTVLAAGLLADLKNNLAFGSQSVKIFEIANIFHLDPHLETTAQETACLGILLYGNATEGSWPRNDAELGYADLKGLVENLFHFWKLDDFNIRPTEVKPWLSPCLEICSGKESAGFMGQLLPEIAKNYHAGKPVWLCEIRLDALFQKAGKTVRFKPLPIYPPVRRDITVMAPKTLKAGEILEQIFRCKLPTLETAFLTDSFEPENSNERYLTFRLVFRSPKKTLKDSEVDKEREKVAQFLQREAGVRV